MLLMSPSLWPGNGGAGKGARGRGGVDVAFAPPGLKENELHDVLPLGTVSWLVSFGKEILAQTTPEAGRD